MLKKLFDMFGNGDEEQEEKKNYHKQQAKPYDDDEDDDEDDYDSDFDDDDDDDEEPELKDLDFTDEEEENLDESDGIEGTYDPVTFHSLQYTEQQFLDEVEKRLELFVKNREAKGKVFTEADILDLRADIGQRLFRKWNNGQRFIKFVSKWQERVYNITSINSATYDETNPLLAPVHGITLYDYAAMINKIAVGVDLDLLLKALGVEKPVWEEAITLWGNRLMQDTTATVSSVYGQFISKTDEHPKLGHVGLVEKTPEAQMNLEKLMNDEYFYTELFAAQTAALEHGYDAAQWLLDTYGLTLMDLQKAIMKWSVIRSENPMDKKYEQIDKHMLKMEEKYAAEFTKQLGGGIADDIEF